MLRLKLIGISWNVCSGGRLKVTMPFSPLYVNSAVWILWYITGSYHTIVCSLPWNCLSIWYSILITHRFVSHLIMVSIVIHYPRFWFFLLVSCFLFKFRFQCFRGRMVSIYSLVTCGLFVKKSSMTHLS